MGGCQCWPGWLMGETLLRSPFWVSVTVPHAPVKNPEGGRPAVEHRQSLAMARGRGGIGSHPYGSTRAKGTSNVRTLVDTSPATGQWIPPHRSTIFQYPRLFYSPQRGAWPPGLIEPPTLSSARRSVLPLSWPSPARSGPFQSPAAWSARSGR